MKSPLYVIVRFEVNEGELETLFSLIQDFFANEVSTFPGFISAKFHRNEEGTVLINYATWESVERFQAFIQLAIVSERSKRFKRISQPKIEFSKFLYNLGLSKSTFHNPAVGNKNQTIAGR